MPGSLTEGPSLAQVQADYFSREALVTPPERARRRQDFAHAALLERQQALQLVAPGSGVAWALTKAVRLPAIPLHPTALEPIGDPITSPVAVLDYWAEHPTHAVGVRLGAHQAARLALVGVRVETWAAWQAWQRKHGVESERVRPWSDLTEKGDLEKTWHSFGAPSFAVWTGPPAPAFRMWDSFGEGALAEDAARLRELNRPEDRGGFLYWTAGPQEGRLPVLRGRQLGAGLTVLADSDVLPLWAATAEGWTLRQDGLVREPGPATDCPAWLLDRLGARWVEAA